MNQVKSIFGASPGAKQRTFFADYWSVLLAAAAVVASFSLTGCEEKTVNNIVGPSTCANTVGKPTLEVRVTSKGCDLQSCRADYSVTATGVLERISWSFTGGTPGTSSSASGSVSWPRGTDPLPLTKDWSVTACTCSFSEDVDGSTCTPQSNSVSMGS